VTFNAVVQPFMMLNEREQAVLAPAQQQGRVRLLQLLSRAVTASVRDETGQPDVGSEGADECVAHYRLECDGLLDNLKDYAADLEQNDLELVLKDEQQTRFNQLIRINEPAVFVPQYFFYPIWVQERGLRRPLFVGSTPRLLDELAIINKVLGLFIPDKMPAFLDATEEDLEDYPFGRGSELWVNLGFVFLQKLAEAGNKHRLPIIINL